MGSYDTVHASNRCGQTKALGKRSRDLVVGDAAEVIPAPMNDEELAAWHAGTLQPLPERDFAVAMGAGGCLVVEDATVAEWADVAPAGRSSTTGGIRSTRATTTSTKTTSAAAAPMPPCATRAQQPGGDG
jgi:hypothetical protein